MKLTNHVLLLLIFCLVLIAARHGSLEVSRMSVPQRKMPSHFIPIHADNVNKNDWIILLEAGTIVGRSEGKLRVASATQER